MIKKFIVNSMAVATALSGMFFVSVSANAATADEVAALARSYGYSEEQIQQGYNEYYSDPEAYPPEKLDQVIEYLRRSGNQIIEPGLQVTTSATTAEPAQTVTTANNASNAGAGNVTVTGTNSQGQPATTTTAQNTSSITIKADDGSSFERISHSDFINMSYEEKVNYIRSFTTEQQQAIINSLTPEEYRSMLKQMPAEQKAEVVGELSKAAGAMGLNLTVEDLSDDSLTVAMRNSDGELLGRSTSGITVEDTGYDRTPLYIAAGSLFLAALGILTFVTHYSFRKPEKINGK